MQFGFVRYSLFFLLMIWITERKFGQLQTAICAKLTSVYRKRSGPFIYICQVNHENQIK
jgi:hypothetical protein